ncbi:MAG TPA: chromosome segregation protein SMC [bacterium]|nr:chromosome segregation protein SMC [bacterium]
MKLKQIQLQGFKSFVDRTVINFTTDITCVVGPNGCGKSNLVDAIRWSLGEQSVKHLRGGTMEDVIFHGTEDMPAVGMAEVAMIFDNSDALCPPEYAGFPELQVTRRLFRSGESEYYINRAPSRLKDITDLFLGSGVGTRAYSIIEQGRIEGIITMKPEQRRTLIEEAAGVSKYRVRKLEAARKMEATRQNLLRIRDIIAELKRQMNSLNRQAKKAERYKEYRGQLREVETELAAYKARGIIAEQQAVAEKLAEISDRELELSARLESRSAELEAEKTSLLELEREAGAAQARAVEASRAAEKLESELNMLRQEAAGLGRTVERLAGEHQELAARAKSVAAEQAEARAECDGLARSIASAEEELNKAEAALNQKEAEYRELAEAADVLSRLALNLKAGVEKLEERIAWTDRRRAELDEQKARAQERREKLEQAIEEQARTNLSYNEKLYQVRKDLAEQGRSLEIREQDLAKAKTVQAVAADRLQNVQQSYTMAHSRLASLEEMKQNFEGCQRGVKAIMARKSALEAQGRNGTYGLIADAVSIDPEYETALEAVLGEKLQSIFVRTRRHGLDNIQYLREAGEGRGSFVPIEGVVQREVSVPAALMEAGAVPLAQKVRVEGEFAPVVKALVGDALVVNDIERAAELRESVGALNALVTREGVVMDRVGAVAGGSADTMGGLLAKNREMEELNELIASLTGERRSAEDELHAAQLRIEEAADAFNQDRERMHRLEIEKNNIEKDLWQGTNAYNATKEEQGTLLVDLAAIEETVAGLEREKEDARAGVIREGEARASVENDQESRRSVLARIHAEREAESQRRTAEKVRVASFHEKLAGQLKHMERLEAARAEAIAGMEKRERESEETRTRISELTARDAELKERHGRAMVAATEAADAAAGERARYEERSRAVREGEAAHKEMFREREQIKSGRMDTELLQTQLQLQWEQLCENARDKFGRELDAVLAEYGERIRADFPVEARREQREELRQKLERIGDVNLTAIEEYAEIEQRHSFLANQEADLIAALENLELTIAKINTAYKKSFRQTFEEVNLKFQEVFPRLFNGGKAFLQLQNPEDDLESGVEIWAQPPGKKMSSIALLSGGEKALTASALIMALFLIKPSPFCLFDEVDAALDDVNIARFNDLLTDLSHSSQLIIITHNKRTMALADVLYGVTMEKKGASKIVSVRLKGSENAA